MGKFVCAFRGRRDSYQVALALAEVDLLDRFITHAYAVTWLKTFARLAPRSIRAKLDFRCEPRIPTDRVCCLWAAILLEHTHYWFGCARMLLERVLSRADFHRRRNDILFAWHNVPAPILPLYLAMTSINGLCLGLRRSSALRMLHGLMTGYLECWKRHRERAPIPASIYWLDRRLKKHGALQLSEVEPLLPLAPDRKVCP